MKILIIDSLRAHRLYISKLVSDSFKSQALIKEADGVAEALKLLDSEHFDLLLMDIELSDGIGFEILKQVKDHVFVIIVSARKEYAIEAFKYDVTDYILKPVNTLELKHAVSKALHAGKHWSEKNSQTVKSDHALNMPVNAGGLMISYKRQYISIQIKDILFIKALGKNSQIFLRDNKQYMSYKNLKEFETAMSQEMVRTHHSYLVNLNHIISFSTDTSQVLLQDGVEVPVSVRKREVLFRKFRVF